MCVCVCVCVWFGVDEKVRGEVTFSWVNGMTAISFKSFREGAEQQNNYVTPNWRQREGAREQREGDLPPPPIVWCEMLGNNAANSPLYSLQVPGWT